MNGYIRPAVIATYSIRELTADAAVCAVYVVTSDRDLKRDIETIEQPLEAAWHDRQGLAGVRTRAGGP